MPALSRNAALISPEEYLAGELVSPIKHEYLGGNVHAMAGATNVHNRIAKKILVALDNRLRGQPCEPYNSDTKVRIRMPSGQIRFYYPDVQVVCDPNPPDETFQDRPVIVVEVSSPSTRRIDEGEKLEAYLTIPTLDTYLLVDASQRQVVVHQRTGNEFSRTVFSDETETIRFTNPVVELTLAEIYADVVFPPPELTEE